MSDQLGPGVKDRVALRGLVSADLAPLFAMHSDADACRIAAVNARTWNAFQAHWSRIFQDPSIVAKAIVEGETLVGNISSFKLDGQDYVGYWIEKEKWGRGIATRALALMLELVATRPLHARVARHNPASIRVLQRNGFSVTGYHWNPGDDRFIACEEAHLVLS
jgi:RimJ/RimL family protein N-acetyltransferase